MKAQAGLYLDECCFMSVRMASASVGEAGAQL